MAFSELSHLECSREHTTYDADVVQGTSSVGAPLLARYDLARVAASVTPAEIATRPPDLWRYHEVLPVRDAARVVTLGEGMTPLLRLPRAGARLGVPGLLMKDEGLVPTGAFKARGAAVGVSRAAELGVTGIAMPTNGNAGAAWASYAARAGIRALIAMPVDAPVITRRECVVAGAELYLVDGLIGDAGRLVAAAVGERAAAGDQHWQDTSTLKEPYRLEGKKTMGYEIAEQLGWRFPDVLLYPTGGGVGIIAIHKAMRELQELGWVQGDLPRLVAVQATGCAPIVDAFEAGLDESTAPADARTVAFGITVPKALGDFLVLQAVRETGGTAIAVTDDELLAAQQDLARDEGTWICPEGAACFAAVDRLRQSGWLAGDEEVVVLNTGTGLIYPDTVPVDVPTLAKDGAIPGGAGMSARQDEVRAPGRVFGTIERIGRLVPHPFYLFWYLLIAIGVLSAVLAANDATAQLPGADQATAVRNILSVAGLQHLLTTFVPNFIGFPPLGVVLAVMLGVGVAERTGFLRTAVAASLSRVPARWMPLAVCFVAGQGHVMGDAGFLVLPPLAALAFRAVGRHPVAGMLGAFAGLSAGYGSGLLIGALDANLSALTTAAVPDGTDVSTSVLMNYWFQAAAGLVLPVVVAWVLVRWVEPGLAPYDPTAGESGESDAPDDLAEVTPRERRALRVAVLALGVYLVLILAGWLVPGGPLRGDDGDLIASPFFDGIVPLVMIAFLVVGIAYGVAAGTIEKADDVPRLMADSVWDMRFFVVVAFAAGQFIAMFDWSGVGDWLAVEGSSVLKDANVGGLGALLLALVVSSLLGLVIFSGSSLWAVLSPVFVPVFVGLGIHPATIQATYRIGDSITNPVSPLNPYIYVLQDSARRYDPDFDIGKVFARMSLFVLPVAVFWVLILVVFYLLGIPTGPGAPVHL